MLRRNIVRFLVLHLVILLLVLFSRFLSAQQIEADRFNRLPFNTSPLPTESPIESSASFYEMVYDADMILSAEIISVDGDVTDDVFAEMYTLMKVSGLVATARGTRDIPDEFILRVPVPWLQSEIEGNHYILFIKNNLLSYNPIRRAFPVKEGIVHHNIFTEKPLLLIDEVGEIKTSPSYNSCDLSEYHDIYNPNEPLEFVVSFTCANGSQWNRGNERPDDYVEQVMTSSALLATASIYMSRHSIPDPILTIGTPDSVNKPLRREFQLTEQREYSDGIFKRYIDHFDRNAWSNMRTILPSNDSKMINFVKREIARGKTVNQLPSNVRIFSDVLEADRVARINHVQEQNNVVRTRRKK